MYRIIDLEQNSAEWHEFRDFHIGASDAPIIYGASPWMTPRELYLQKTPFGPKRKPMTAKMQRGHDLEPYARNELILQLNMEFKPVVLEFVEYPFISCSLDGISVDGKTICEIKCPNARTHEDSFNGKIPFYYELQIQHALMVTGANYCWYFSYRPEHAKSTSLVKIQRNDIIIREILNKEIDFWDRVVNLRGIEPIKLEMEK